MKENFNIAGYCRISVDEELDRDNTSIENQKSIIKDYVKRTFPDSNLTFYEDRDRSGYTFEQREGYQTMRPYLMGHKYDILVVKDFSRFSRRNSRGLVELEDLRDAGVRIISIGDSIDYPTCDDWTAIQFRFLVNEMPVTDASKKVKSVIRRRQEDGKWICAVPYGYVISNSKAMTVEAEPTEAEVVRTIFRLYLEGWGYKRIADHLTDNNIPTPRMKERARKEAKGEECRLRAKRIWSIATVQGILSNDFYIGTLRQGKYTRRKINGRDIKREKNEHIVFEDDHEAIVDKRTFVAAAEAMKKRTTSNYRGVKKYNNVYSGLMECGDCGSPMFSMSRSSGDAYRCGLYHRRGLKGCTSHHIRADLLDSIIKEYLGRIRDTSADMIDKLQKEAEEDALAASGSEDALDVLEDQLADAKEEKKALIRRCARDIMRRPEREEETQSTYDELISECDARIDGIEKQIAMAKDKRSAAEAAGRTARKATGLFTEIIEKEHLDKGDIELIVEKIYVYEDHIHIKLKDDIECILRGGTNEASGGKGEVMAATAVQKNAKHRDRIFGVNVVSEGDPLEIYTDREGEVIFKKYSPIGELTEFAAQYAETLHKTCGLNVAICDRDAVIACAGIPKKEYNDKGLSSELEEAISTRSLYIGGEDPIHLIDGGSCTISCMMPIIAEGDIAGCVVSIFDSDGNRSGGDAEVKLIQTAATFLGKQLEN